LRIFLIASKRFTILAGTVGAALSLATILMPSAWSQESNADMKTSPPKAREGGVIIDGRGNDASFGGTWQGTIKLGNGMELPVVFHFQKSQEKYTGTMDSPMQGQMGLAFEVVNVDDSGKIHASLENNKASYVGALDDSRKAILGSWLQAGSAYPLNFQLTDRYHGPNRPQEPKEPFPYKTEAVKIESGSVTLPGVLTVPEDKGPYPAVILIHGSGPLDRDETMFSHKPFFLLSDYLTRRGIAVLRYDKRGFAKSTGDYKACTSEDFAADVLKAIEFLKARPEIDGKKIGLLGHSEGGFIAPMVASKCGDVHFIVMMAASALPGDQILLSQLKAIGTGQGEKQEAMYKSIELAKETYAIIKSENNNDQAIEKIKAMRKRLNASEYQVTGNQKAAQDGHVETSLKLMTSPWYRFFLSYDPRPSLAKVHCPVLALNGDRDTQVIAQANLDAIKTALQKGGNKDSTEIVMPGLNHLFQTCKTGLPEEYASIEETVSPKALQVIGDWIIAH
jgi:uncharacterized protein